jgi:hypothetical protein
MTEMQRLLTVATAGRTYDACHLAAIQVGEAHCVECQLLEVLLTRARARRFSLRPVTGHCVLNYQYRPKTSKASRRYL